MPLTCLSPEVSQRRYQGQAAFCERPVGCQMSQAHAGNVVGDNVATVVFGYYSASNLLTQGLRIGWTCIVGASVEAQLHPYQVRSPSCAIALSYNPTDLLTFRAAFLTFFAAPLAALLAFLTVDDRARFAIKMLLFPSAWTSLVDCDSLTAAKCRMLICEVILNFAELLRRQEVGAPFNRGRNIERQHSHS